MFSKIVQRVSLCLLRFIKRFISLLVLSQAEENFGVKYFDRVSSLNCQTLRIFTSSALKSWKSVMYVAVEECLSLYARVCQCVSFKLPTFSWKKQRSESFSVDEKMDFAFKLASDAIAAITQKRDRPYCFHFLSVRPLLLNSVKGQ